MRTKEEIVNMARLLKPNKTMWITKEENDAWFKGCKRVVFNFENDDVVYAQVPDEPLQ